MKKFILIYLFICWSFIIFMAMTWPMPYVYSSGIDKITLYDKLVHIFFFGVFTYLIIMIGVSFKKNYFIVALTAFILSFNYIILTEYLQGSIQGRNPAYPDLFAGLLGTLVAISVGHLIYNNSKQKLLLHTCCAPCSVYLAKTLKEQYRIILYFYNPNIFPKSEYGLRLLEVKKIAKKFGVKLIVGKYNHDEWRKKIIGLSEEEEGGKRCEICFKHNLEETAKTAKKKNIPFFATSLVVSPKKNADLIHETGKNLTKDYGVGYLGECIEKEISFKESIKLTKKLNIYRQKYCGCEYSIKKLN